MMRSLFCFIMAVGSVLPAAGHSAMSSALENPKATQPDMATLQKLRPKYSRDADALIASSQVITIRPLRQPIIIGNAHSIMINRSASLISGFLASIIGFLYYDLAWPNSDQWLLAGFTSGALIILGFDTLRRQNLRDRPG